jgi:5-methyltetrahydropteroyltriglutamate--homocysteine methyltransferase
VHDQIAAGLDAVSDGEQTRLDFNLGFYGFLQGIEQGAPPRLLGPPAHDQRPRHRVVGELSAPNGLGTVAEYERLRRVAPPGPTLKVAVPGPYTLAGRLEGDRWETAEALVPIVQKELVALAEAGCEEIAIDEPSMSCYAHREDPERLVELFNRTVTPVLGRARLSTHLCFGNYKGRAVAPRRYAPLFPAFLGAGVDEIHLEMASRELAEAEIVGTIAEVKDVAVGVIDVKSYYVETPEDIADRVRHFLRFAPPQRLAFSTDCGLSQTARWAAKAKLTSLVEGVSIVRGELGL